MIFGAMLLPKVLAGDKTVTRRALGLLQAAYPAILSDLKERLLGEEAVEAASDAFVLEVDTARPYETRILRNAPRNLIRLQHRDYYRGRYR